MAPRWESAFIARMRDNERLAIGDPWTITAKRTDFYVEPVDRHMPRGRLHFSCHGPNARHPQHRFHLRVDRQAAAARAEAVPGSTNGIPRNGLRFPGVQVADDAYLVMRLRWDWQLSRDRFRKAAYWGLVDEEAASHRHRVALRGPVLANEAWDLDVYASFGQPYYPVLATGDRGGSRIGPLRNEAGHVLTAVSWGRAEHASPTPAVVYAPPPGSHQTPRRVLLADVVKPGIVWCSQTVTSAEFLAMREQSL